MPSSNIKEFGAALLILEGRDAGRVVTIRSLPFRIGRLQENDLVVADEQVSRQHVQIEQGSTGPTLVDLRSRNGVFVNQKRIDRHTLSVGDRIRLGSTVLIFQTNAKQAREVMADSIPDSPAFALEDRVEPSRPEAEISHEEPTAIRHLVDSESVGFQSSERALAQTAKLFTTSLPPHGVASQIHDIFFQAFLPDRAQVIWQGSGAIHIARSRQEGKKCSPFELGEQLTKKARQNPIGLKQKVPVSHGGGSEERSVLLAPLFAGNEIHGWLYGDRPVDQPPFTSYQLESLGTLASVAAGALERATILSESRELRTQISLMEKHISPEVARMLSAKGISIEESALGVENREVTILFSDIQGFTPLSERLSAEELAQLLNEYFQRMVDIIIAHHGTLNKFIGDAIMALFGAPERHGNDAANAVAAGLDMVTALKEFWHEIDDRKRFNIRVGINTGRVVAGNIGSEKKMEYTVLGDVVNVASRLEGISPPNTVTIGSQTASQVRHLFQLKEVPLVKVKGKSEEMNVFQVLGPLSSG